VVRGCGNAMRGRGCGVIERVVSSVRRVVPPPVCACMHTACIPADVRACIRTR
jgi:hypothetical protein